MRYEIATKDGTYRTESLGQAARIAWIYSGFRKLGPVAKKLAGRMIKKVAS